MKVKTVSGISAEKIFPDVTEALLTLYHPSVF
jgi:hypothetical protein